MSSTPPSGGPLFVESLEARIAPTGLVAIANDPTDPNATGDPRYVTYATAPSTGKLGFVPASTYGVAGSNVYAIKLNGNGGVNGSQSTGDELVIFNATQGFNFSSPFLQATNGNIIAFFTDLNGDGQVQSNELTGISMAKNAAVNVNGSVNGDIVTNLSKDGSAINLTGIGNHNTGISALNVVGNVAGSVVSGGNIDQVSIAGNVQNVLAGSAANGYAYHFATNTSGAAVNTGTITEATFKPTLIGASISNVTLLSLTTKIQAGDGGQGAVGGNVSSVLIQNDTDGFSIYGGAGGLGTDIVKGGVGGNVSNVVVQGVADATAATATGHTILIQGGAGGADSAFKGGAGGTVSGVGTSVAFFTVSSGAFQESADFLDDPISLQGGAGGVGLKGGAGGSVSNAELFGAIPDQVNTNGTEQTGADGTDLHEIQVLGGVGGTGTSGKGGIGGSVNGITAENLDLDAAGLNASIFIQGGAGAAGGGKAGGNVGSIMALGPRITVAGGNGADGANHGGDGGSLESIKILSTSAILAHEVTLNGGMAGSATAGIGGNGGTVDSVQMIDSDISSLIIDSGTQGNGGRSAAGIGGFGGAVTNIQLGDSGPARATAASVAIRSGSGADGSLGGGAGGDIGTFQFFGSDFAYSAVSGTGGSVIAGGAGDGGNGGSFINFGISNQPAATSDPNFATGATGTVVSGAGGNGTGLGGNGGDLSQVSLRTTFGITMTAGNGGLGGSEAAGAGGNILNSAAVALLGSVAATAGNGGTGGATGGDGGEISGFVAVGSSGPLFGAVAGTGNISMIAGNGGAGGAGGDIVNSGTSVNDLTNLPNYGSLTVHAGAGSAGSAASVAGDGGSISVFNGFLGIGGPTSIAGGAGGAGGKTTGGGGSVDQVKLTGDSTDFGVQQMITVDGGNAGVSAAAKHGGSGGSATNITIFNLDTGSLVQHVAAGDGANAIKTGGNGGSIDEVHIGSANDGGPDDIGYRTGVTYGYANAGGLFAGVGGTGSKSAGAAGNVGDVTAAAIASIAAGKTTTVQLANTVDSIYLLGLDGSAVGVNGAYTNFTTANLVGSVQESPTTAGADVFKAGDGLIAALTLTGNRNFTYEAFVTLDGSGNRLLEDYQEQQELMTPPGNPIVQSPSPV